MKKDIHPKWYSDAKVIIDGKTVMTVGSTQPELHVDIWSGTHPFYTGKQRLVDTARRVEKFESKLTKKSEVVIGRSAKKAALKEKRKTKVAVRTVPKKLGSTRNTITKKDAKDTSKKKTAPVAKKEEDKKDDK